MSMDKMPVKNILITVSTKSVIDELLPVLKENDAKIWATSGTAKYIRDKGLEAESIVSGFDFDGRVKSLDRTILAQVLTDKSKQTHLAELSKIGAEPFDVVVVELYKLDEANFPESMDIGGVTLIRAAIKNFENVAVAYDEGSIEELVEHIKTNQGSTLVEFRKSQAKKAAGFIAKRSKQEAGLFP